MIESDGIAHLTGRKDYLMEIINLQLFAGDGAGAGASAGAGDGAANAGTTGEQGAEAAAPQEYISRSGRRYAMPTTGGAQTTAGADDAPGSTSNNQSKDGDQPEDESFEDLIKGRYKQDFEKKIQSILQPRLKTANENKATLDKINQIVPLLNQKFGLEDGATIDDLVKKVNDDDSLYEDEALKMGVSTDVVRDMHRLQRERDEAVQAQQQSVEEARIQAHFEHLSRQAEAFRQIVPGFDLMAEINASPEFARLTSPEVNIPVETAYRAVHAREIESGAMAYGAQRAAQQVAASVKANGQRPAENGMGAQNGAVVGVDPSKLTLKDIEQIKARIRKGEQISFG